MLVEHFSILLRPRRRASGSCEVFCDGKSKSSQESKLAVTREREREGDNKYRKRERESRKHLFQLCGHNPIMNHSGRVVMSHNAYTQQCSHTLSLSLVLYFRRKKFLFGTLPIDIYITG